MEQRGKNNKSFDTMNKNNQNFDEIKQRLLQYVDNRKLKKMVFYDTIGMSQSNFSGEGASSSLKSENIIKVLIAFPDLNPDWLLLGRGDMLRNSDVNQSIEGNSNIQISGNENKTSSNKDLEDKISYLEDKVLFLTEQINAKDNQINTLLSIMQKKH